MQIIHVDIQQRYAVVYYCKDNVIHSKEVDHYCFKEFYDDDNGCTPSTATDKEWCEYLTENEGEQDFGFMDFIVDNPEHAIKFKPFMNSGEIKELNYYLENAA